MKRQATSTNGQDVQLRALEREAKAQRDLLESYLAKYREATTRENIDIAPSDGRIISRAIVSNTPAFPKKLPVVLIATLLTLVLTAGYIATAELLRMTAPRAPAIAAPAASVAPAASAASVASVAPVAPAAAPLRDRPAETPAAASEIERLAGALREAGTGKITVIGACESENTTLTALTLARLLARDAKVVLVDLAMTSPTLAAVSTDPAAPGLTELMQGTAPFGQIITKDRMSGVHLVDAGRDVAQRPLLQLPRINLAIDALQRVYEHVVLDAGTAADLPAAVIAAQAHAVVIPDAAITSAGRAVMRDQLLASGFAGVTILSAPAVAAVPGASEARVAAA